MDFTYQPVERYRAIMALLLHVFSRSPLKPLWEKGKLLVMSNFSFSHVFLWFRKLSAIFIKFEIVCKLSLKIVVWERVNTISIEAFYHTILTLMTLRKRLVNIVGKGENAVNQHFLMFSNP